jgi:glycine cleavage system H protein
MTVLLVLFTLIFFLVADHFVQRARRAMAANHTPFLVPRAIPLPGNIALAQNHTWLQRDRQGITTIGLDELLGRLLGPIEEVILPPVDTMVSPGATTFTLRHGEKILPVASPVAGRIVEVNRHVKTDPSVARLDPYGEGWLVRIMPGTASVETPKPLIGRQAAEWLNRQTTLMKEFFIGQSAQPQFATLQDGGLPADGMLGKFDAGVWREFKKQFVSLPSEALAQKLSKEV